MSGRSLTLAAALVLLLGACKSRDLSVAQPIWDEGRSARTQRGLGGPGSERSRRSALLEGGASLELEAPKGAGSGRIRATAWMADGAGKTGGVLLVNGYALPIPNDGPMPVEAAIEGGQPLHLSLPTGALPVEIGEPIFIPDGAPARRLLLVFVDTLRADHLGAWGYARDTSPHIDALAARGRRYAQASSPAPWTLPATRAAWSGQHPERWSSGASVPLARRFREAGWVSAAIVANPWLGLDQGMAQGWSEHSLWPGADAAAQVDRGIAFLSAQADRDHLLLLHLQDPHLPYREPEALRGRWAGPMPAGLDEGFTGRQLRAMGRLGPDDPRRIYISDRYDQNIAWMDAQVGRLLDAAGPEATVVFFSDHGEELWDHGGVEHGHALGPEIINIPLILAGPGISIGVNQDPVSLLDLLPTLATRFGLPADPDTDGRDLLGPSPGSPTLVAGRLLYGASAWSVRQGDWRWTGHGDTRQVADLAADPTETRPKPATPTEDARAAAAMGALLGLESGPTWRLARPGVAAQSSSAPASAVSLWCPGGFARSWAEPRPGVIRSPPQRDGDRIRLPRAQGAAPTGELFFVRTQAQGDCRLEVEDPTAPADAAIVPSSMQVGDAPVTAGPRGRQASVDRVIVPQLPEAGPSPKLDAEQRQALEALGYQAP